MTRRAPGWTVLRASRPGVGIEMSLRRQITGLLRGMHEDLMDRVRRQFKEDEPRILALVSDATPSDQLRRAVDDVAREWQSKFDRAARGIGEYFAEQVDRRSTAELRRVMKQLGITVKPKMTPAIRDVLDASVNQAVSLIKSIPQQYHKDVSGAVQRSVQQGRDLKTLTDHLEDAYGVSRRRAKWIALDQNNKAAAAVTRVRRTELGLYDAIWMHSHAGKEPRPSHVAMNGRHFDIREGMWDPAEQRHIQPGELINCRCSSRPAVRGEFRAEAA